jgi:signal transduction histidine kinase
MIKEKNNLIRKFSLYSILIIEDMVMQRTKSTTVSIVEISAKTNHLTDLTKKNYSQENRQSFKLYYDSLKTDEIIRIKIFNNNGTIIYSDKEELIGQTFNDNEELSDALKGSIKVEINRDLNKQENIYERQNFSSLMEIYVPIRDVDGKIGGVVELYEVLDIIDDEIYDLQFTVAIIIFLGLGILYLSLIWIVKGAATTILEQNIALSKAIEDLKSIDIMKNHFINTMSHELRTPLNSIIGFSDILKQKTVGELNGIQEKYLDNIQRSGQHLLTLVNDILDLIIIDAGKLELVIRKMPVDKTIDQNIEQILSKADTNRITIRKDIDPQLEFIEVDIDKFTQILQHLLDNAVKFSKAEGGAIKITAKKIGDLAQFSISDNGIGIKEEDLGKLFHVFQQLDSGIAREYGGTGLGLSISKKLVELHGGKIWAEGKYGEGTTVIFQLPVESKKGGTIS